MMSANLENSSPETSGLLAANSGYALVEAAFIPASRRIGPGSLWFIAAISLATLAAAAGVTIAGDKSSVMALADPVAVPDAAAPTAAIPEAAVPVPARSAEPRVAPAQSAKNLRPLPVVLRGQPPSRTGGHS
jgi:hypothetical protein